MNELAEKIFSELSSHSVILIGPMNSGKTHWVQHTLIPYLESRGKHVSYLKDGDQRASPDADIVICDEAETLADAEYLRGNSAQPYYSAGYLETVHRWFKNYSSLPRTSVFILTRNEPSQIQHLLETMQRADWDRREITMIQFTHDER